MTATQHPKKVQAIINKYCPHNEPMEYSVCEAMKKDLKKIGWTMEYDMDGMPYDINPMFLIQKNGKILSDNLDKFMVHYLWIEKTASKKDMVIICKHSEDQMTYNQFKSKYPLK